MFKTKKTVKFIASTIFAITLSVFYSQSARASGSAELIINGGSVVKGFINTTNTSFSVNNIDISLLQSGQTANLTVETPLRSISLQSYTEPAIESYTMPSGETPQNYFDSGVNIIKLEISDLSGVLSKVELPPVTADFDVPTATVSSSIVKGGVLKIGDKVTFTVLPNEKLKKVSSAYNGKPISLKENPDLTWSGAYIVASGDPDQVKPLALSGVKITDLSGNLATLADHPTNFTIDANAPKVTILSPENSKIYNTREIPLKYLVNDPKATIIVLVNGKPVDLKADLNLADGSYKLSVQATDRAGNVTVSYSNFSVDTTAPDFSAVINPDGGRVEKGWTIVFDGATEPGATIEIEIFSDPLSNKTTADASGHYRIEFFAGDLDIGSHDVYITVTDQTGNSKRVKISSFEIYSIAAIEKSAKIAFASSSIASDVKQPIVKTNPKKEEPVEVAQSGRLGGASDSARMGGINWSAWIILLGLIVFASALATAGYYGYEWMAVSSEARRQSKQGRGEDIDEETALLKNQRDVYQTIKEVAQKLEKPKKELDEEVEAKDNTPKTRW